MTSLRNDLLDWCTRTRHRITTTAHKYDTLLYAAAVAAAFLIGAVVAGNTDDERNQLAATDPHVAAQVTDPTVESWPTPVGSVATCEWERP